MRMNQSFEDQEGPFRKWVEQEKQTLKVEMGLKYKSRGPAMEQSSEHPVGLPGVAQ